MTHAQKSENVAEVLMEEARSAFTCDEFAQATVISIPMVRKLIKAGKLRAVRIGRCVRIPKTELRRILDQGAEECRK